MCAPPCHPAGFLPVGVHRLADEHLTDLPSALGADHARYYRDRLPLQSQDRGFILLAMAGATPVGGIFVSRDPPDEPEVRADLPGVPMLHKAVVAAGLRRRRVGTQLLGGTHELLRRMGHRQVALGVDAANPDAARLYRRLGYVRWPHRTYGSGSGRYCIMTLDLVDGDRTRGRGGRLCACALAAGDPPGRCGGAGPGRGGGPGPVTGG